MARGDWEYIAIPKEQAKELDNIVQKQGRKYGLVDRNELIRAIIADFITRFEEKKDLSQARKMINVVL
jgi:metal-responsive CopG/Arc/MetJ family transcriptional regulator